MYDVTNFMKVSGIMSPSICHFRFLIFVLETLQIEWQCTQYLGLSPTCGKGAMGNEKNTGKAKLKNR